MDNGSEFFLQPFAKEERSGRLSQSCECARSTAWRLEEHTSELQSLMRISYAVFCLKKQTGVPCVRPATSLCSAAYDNDCRVVGSPAAVTVITANASSPDMLLCNCFD